MVLVFWVSAGFYCYLIQTTQASKQFELIEVKEASEAAQSGRGGVQPYADFLSLNRFEDPGLDEAQSYMIVTNNSFWRSGGLYSKKKLRQDSVD